MKSTLVLIAPIWTPELEELLRITRESFDIKVLTQKQDLTFSDPYMEILQCLDSYSPFELTKLLPWLLQMRAPHFHVLLPNEVSTSQLAGVTFIISMIQLLPQFTLSHSPWPEGGLHFSLWKKAFQMKFTGSLQNFGSRVLSLTNKNDQGERSSTLSDLGAPYLWVFPGASGINEDWQPLIQNLISKDDSKLEIWNWSKLPLRKQNQVRNWLASAWNRVSLRDPRLHLENWQGVRFLVLVGNASTPFSESDLLDLILRFELEIIMDLNTRNRLNGPWRENDTYWLWHPSEQNNPGRPWNNTQCKLPFSSILTLRRFQDQISNQILRSLNKLDFRK